MSVGLLISFRNVKSGMGLNARSMNDVNDDCLATGEGPTERNSEFQVGIEPTTSITPVGCSNHQATRTPGELGWLTGFFFTHSVPLPCQRYSIFHISSGMKITLSSPQCKVTKSSHGLSRVHAH